jgi:hypothetical protein
MKERDNPSHPHRKRKHPRFALNYPVQLKFRGEGNLQILEAMSHNISLGGVFLHAAGPVPQNCDVEFVVTVPRNPTREPIRLKGTGRVVRIEQTSSGAFGVAIECKRPIYRIISQIRPSLA